MSIERVGRVKKLGVLCSLILALFLGMPAHASAAAPQPAVDIVSAKLVNGGSGVFATATFTCRAGAAGLLTVSITQTRGTRTPVTADGQNEGGFTCTGEPQTVSALVAVQPGGGQFRPGSAQAGGNVLQCDEFDCDSINSTERITIKK